MKYVSAFALVLAFGILGSSALGLTAKSPGCDPSIHDCTNAGRIV